MARPGVVHVSRQEVQRDHEVDVIGSSRFQLGQQGLDDPVAGHNHCSICLDAAIDPMPLTKQVFPARAVVAVLSCGRIRCAIHVAMSRPSMTT
jgi:hypothetical protein